MRKYLKTVAIIFTVIIAIIYLCVAILLPFTFNSNTSLWWACYYIPIPFLIAGTTQYIDFIDEWVNK